MKNRTEVIFILQIVIFVITMISAEINAGSVLYAISETGKVIISDKQTPADEEKKNEKNPHVQREDNSETNKNIPVINDSETSGVKDGMETQDKDEQTYIKPDELKNHPDIILNAYKEAYPELIEDVIRCETDWIIKFKNGNIYYWCDGKLLPEKLIPLSEKYTKYTIYPYNINGRFPELYTEEVIEKLRVKKQPRKRRKKKEIIPGVEGSFYNDLFAITTRKSAKKQLTEVKLSGHYITVHKTIAEKVKTIDSKISELAKTDTEVRDYLQNISRVEAFNWRRIAGTARMSNHSYGLAIDILPKKYRKKTIYWLWEQAKNDQWMLLPQSSLWAPPDPVVKIFHEEGFVWGGNWDRYDTMHFEYRPELISLYKKINFE